MKSFVVVLIIFTIIYLTYLYFDNQHQSYIKSVSISSPTPDPNSSEYKEFMRSYCNFLADTDDLDCSDFSSHYEAQRTYNNTIKCFGFDYFRLDGDHDGIACESLP